ncbi:dynein light intermediate chain-domain-containing protein [Radiomyces spectabilis]|uniref:dynein light intermediate chain-domain-containing protein n=1 Tax=Radiomyces spectabilis TaxID=64574 RepID=UPI00221FC623|nr:dynein light intermediate chain-domain-containing protein [Radiomyces spectabilis]KAI8384276.1 dynein light intermediate chain-domain-containing protein [Radiomyces spectabilis]
MTVPLPTSSPLLAGAAAATQTTSTTSGTGVQTAPEKDEIWSTILKGVASSKMISTKHILILGDPGCGKSTLIHYLKNDPGPQAHVPESDDTAAPTSFGVGSSNYTPMPVENLDQDATNTLALGYTFVDIQDEENEAIARLGLYQLGLSAPEYLPLLKFAFSSETLANSMVIIALDWTRPWKFLETLQRWIDVLQHAIDEICKEGSAGESWSRGKAIVDELREKVEHYLQSYTEPTPAVNGINMAPSTSTSSIPSTPTGFVPTPLVTTTTAADQVTLPLTQGCLTTNLGIPIAVVCCKSDALNKLEQTQDYKEEQFDFIQQTLRCICMKYGASLFYTSTLHPYTFHNLRQYILHRLLTTSTKSYPFMLKAQVIERDSVLVPSGWDSWGKIRVLREGFDCESIHQGWDADIEAVIDRQQPGAHGARGIFEEAIPDPEIEEQPLNIPATVTCEDEQVFLERHFETLQRAPEGPTRQGTGSAIGSTRPSVVGPLGVSPVTIDLMRVGADRDSDRSSRHKANHCVSSLTQDTMLDKAGLGKVANSPNPVDRIQTMGSNGTPVTGGPASPLSSANAGAAGGPSHEVLANFFQSLLSKKASSGSGSPTAASPASSLLAAGGTSPTGRAEDGSSTGRRATISRKDVHKELDRMRQFVNKP